MKQPTEMAKQQKPSPVTLGTLETASIHHSFLAAAHRELSVMLVKCQGSVYRGCANLLAQAAGHQALPGAGVPYED